MQNDEIRDDVLDKDIETSEEETVEESQDESTESDVEALDADALRAEALKWKAIALRNKKKVNTQVDQTTQKKEINNNNQDQDNQTLREELTLVAKGYSDDEIAHLKVIAQGSQTSLKEAEQSELFTAIKEKKAQEAKAQKAKIGASKGSAITQAKDMKKLSDDEHREAWFEKIGLNQ